VGARRPVDLTTRIVTAFVQGRADKALELLEGVSEPPVRARALGVLADAAVQLGAAGRDRLPEALRGQHDLIIRAFGLAEAGEDEPARETLQGIGLQSPFLEWKLFLRGLIAYYQNDDARALENWQRLSTERLPARLVAPLRYLIDSQFRLANPPEAQAYLQQHADRLQGSALVRQLRALQPQLADAKRLAQAFRGVEGLMPALKQQAPRLVPRLAHCFYWAVINHGGLEDVLRYQRVFGMPADDPRLDRLRALLFEQMLELDKAHRSWQQFEKSVATNGAGWPAPPGTDPAACRDRVRALIWARMGQNAANVPDLDQFPELPPFLRFHPSRPKPLAPDAEQCFRRSLELAPDQLAAHTALLDYYQRQQKSDQALEAARRLLERFPEHVPTLEALGDLHTQRQEYGEALRAFQEALRLNPLDRRLRAKVCLAHVFRARPLVEEGMYDAARADFRAAQALEEPKDSGYLFCKWAACEFKAGAADRAAALLDQALACGGSAINRALQMLIEAIRLKLSRPLKARFEKEFTALLAEAPTGQDAAAVAATAAAHRMLGVGYYGQKTHEKKVLAYVEKARKADFGEGQLLKLCRALLGLEAFPLARTFAALGRRRFPGDPWFCFIEAEALFARGDGRAGMRNVQPLLERARQLAGALPPDDQRQALLDLVQQRLQMIGLSSQAFSMLEDLFGEFGMDDDDFWDDDDAEPPPRRRRR
jgi:tetratricopeptide (TPR) repeat protein